MKEEREEKRTIEVEVINEDADFSKDLSIDGTEYYCDSCSDCDCPHACTVRG